MQYNACRSHGDPAVQNDAPTINHLITRRTLPMLVIGSGRAGLANKLFLTMHAIKLEVRVCVFVVIVS